MALNLQFLMAFSSQIDFIHLVEANPKKWKKIIFLQLFY